MECFRFAQYSFELLLQFLHGADLMLMLAVLNQHINIEGTEIRNPLTSENTSTYKTPDP